MAFLGMIQGTPSFMSNRLSKGSQTAARLTDHGKALLFVAGICAKGARTSLKSEQAHPKSSSFCQTTLFKYFRQTTKFTKERPALALVPNFLKEIMESNMEISLRQHSENDENRPADANFQLDNLRRYD